MRTQNQPGERAAFCKVFLSSIACLTALFIPTDRAFAAIMLASAPSIIANGTAPQDGFNLTLDTESGLEWLDVTLTTNLSWNAVTALMAPGGDLDGFRHGTVTEMEEFLAHAGFIGLPGPGVNDPKTSTDPDKVLAMSQVQSMVGITGVFVADTYQIPFSAGRYDLPSPTSLLMMEFFIEDYSNFPDVAGTRIGNGSGPNLADEADRRVGHWLVRQSSAVPEPSSFALLAFGLLAVSTTLAVKTRSRRRENGQCP